jgi:hypothetical protein
VARAEEPTAQDMPVMSEAPPVEVSGS